MGISRWTAIAAGSNIELLERQIREFHPRLCGVWEEEKAKELAVRVDDTDTKIVSGMDGLLEVAVMEDRSDPGDGHRGNDRDPSHHCRH